MLVNEHLRKAEKEEEKQEEEEESRGFTQTLQGW